MGNTQRAVRAEYVALLVGIFRFGKARISAKCCCTTDRDILCYLGRVKISIDELKAQPQHIDFKETIEGLEAVKPVLGEITLSLSSYGVKVIGRVQTMLKLNCDRCLRPYFQSLSLDINEQLVYPSENEPQRERELLKDDFVELLPDDGLIDVTDIIYQAITLAKPSHYSCGSECPGLPAGAKGTGGNTLAGDKKTQDLIDPRWKNLKTIFSNDEKDKN